ncbi:hypothetical protein PAPHI01_2569 [Pancytospora philotis]|nr:hypothetical protein PAPHI01_2569 [Pancytospora philotis]
MKNFLSSRFNTPVERASPPHSQDSCTGGAHHMPSRAIDELFADYRVLFIRRNFVKIEQIIASVMQIDSGSPVLQIIHADMAVYRGEMERARRHLAQYIGSVPAVDPYAAQLIAFWNYSCGFGALAAAQYARALPGLVEHPVAARALLAVVAVKKRARFLDAALRSFSRLLAVPEGFKLYPCIQFHIIHIYIMKNDIDAALNAISFISMYFNSPFIRRLTAYANYKLKNYKCFLSTRCDASLDPYVAYLIARVALAEALPDIDVSGLLGLAIKASPDSAGLHNTLGNHWLGAGNYKEARACYERALACDSRFQCARKNMLLVERLAAERASGSESSEPFVLAPAETEPDVEETGFFNIWSMLGYANAKVEDKAGLMPLTLSTQME